MATTIGVKIELEGAPQYQENMRNLTQQTKLYEAQMKNVEKQLKNGASAFQRSMTESRALEQQLQAQEQQLKGLEGAISDATAKYGENSTQVLKLKTQYEQLEGKIADTKARIHEHGGTIGAVGSQLQEVGGKLQEVGGKISAIGDAMMPVTAAIAGVATASVAAFNEVDDAMDTIVKKTGATGDSLKEMEGIAQDIATTIPTSFNDAASAVGEVNTRFELTGEELKTLSQQFVEFADLNGTDVSSSIDSVQSAMAAFGISAEDASLYLDTLNAAGQQTGVNVQQLADSMAQNAASLKEMGYGASDAAMLLANMEKNGVDASSAMTGLKKAYAQSIKEGTSMSDVLMDLQNRLQDDSTYADAAAEAIELFGTRSGGALVEAISSGRLSLEELGTSMSDFAGSVDSTFQGTVDPIDEMQIHLNELKILGAEIATSAMPMISQAMQVLGDVIQKVSDAWNGLDENQQQMIIKAALIVAAIGPVLSIGGRLISGIGTVVSTIGTLTSALPGLIAGIAALNVPLLPIIAIIAAVVAAGVLLYKNWDKIKEVAGNLKDALSEKWEGIKAKTTEVWNNVKETTSTVMDAVKQNMQERLNNMKAAYDEHGGGLKGTVAALWTGIKDNYKQGFMALNTLTGGKLGEIANKFINKFNELKNNALGWGKDIIQNLVNGIMSKIQDAAKAAGNIAEAIKSKLGFSEPESGPLSDFHTYMPDMIDLLTKGIYDNLYKVDAASDAVAGALAGGTQNSYNYGGFSIVVNGAEGQSAAELADVIEDRIQAKMAAQKAVWA